MLLLVMMAKTVTGVDVSDYGNDDRNDSNQSEDNGGGDFMLQRVFIVTMVKEIQQKDAHLGTSKHNYNSGNDILRAAQPFTLIFVETSNQTIINHHQSVTNYPPITSFHYNRTPCNGYKD